MCFRYMSRQFVTVVIGFLFIFPLCFFKRLDALSYVSFVGCITILYVVCLITYKNFTKTTVTVVKVWPDNVYEALHIVPIICFAYQVCYFVLTTRECIDSHHYYYLISSYKDEKNNMFYFFLSSNRAT